MEYLDQFLDFSNNDKNPLKKQGMSDKSENIRLLKIITLFFLSVVYLVLHS